MPKRPICERATVGSIGENSLIMYLGQKSPCSVRGGWCTFFRALEGRELWVEQVSQVLVEAGDAQVGGAADDAVETFELVHHELEQLWGGVGGGGA